MAGLALAPVVYFLRTHGYAPLWPTFAVVAVIGVAAWAGAAATSRRPLIRAALVAAVTTAFVDLGFDVDTPVPGIGTNKLLAAIFAATFLWHRAFPDASTRIGSAIAATVLLSSLVLPYRPVVADEGVRAEPRTADPPLVHIVLDEFMGVEGLAAAAPAGPADFVRSRLERAGFLVFGRAYSQDFSSAYSLARVLNLQADRARTEAVRPATSLHETVLASNAYFDGLVSRGYALDVIQTTFVGLCPPSLPAACRTYDAWKLGTSAFRAAPVGRQLDIMHLLFWRQSAIWSAVQRATTWTQQARGDAPVLVSPFTGMAVLDDLASRLRTGAHGHAYFAHVPMPHYPYVYDAACQVRPARAWLYRHDPSAPAGTMNTPAGRRARYDAYDQQLRCVMDRIDAVLQALPAELADEAVVLIHGDHGSRITERDPEDPDARDSDFVDGYSTLFAIRAPAIDAGYRDTQVPLACLLRALVAARFEAPDVSTCGSAEPVFGRQLRETPWIRMMPEIRRSRPRPVESPTAD
jgi:hypothetical protein